MREHSFTRVDEDAHPAAWVKCLDTLHAEPFYRDYKQRVVELLSPLPAGLYLELGSGVGTDALKLGARVIGVDRSATMCRESRRRGLSRVVVADADALPFRSELVDGCWADRTFQHLADPQRALSELARVMKPDARIVVVDPDYGTQVMDCPDPELAGKVFDFRARHMLRNGTLASRMADLFSRGSLEDVSVERRTLTVRDPSSLDNVMGLRSWARTAAAHGALNQAEALRWEALYDALVDAERLRWAVDFVITSARKPPRSARRSG